jgi:hypothetical protein
MPQRGYRTQPRVSTLGTTIPERRALKGRQIESTNNAEVEINGTHVIAHSQFAQLAQIRSWSVPPSDIAGRVLRYSSIRLIPLYISPRSL